MDILKLEGIGRIYQRGDTSVTALTDLDLRVEKGEFVAIIGPSGSGKTTLLNILGCLDLPSSGTMIYAGTPVHGLSEKGLSEYRRAHLAFIFQSFNLIPVLTVRENVELPLVIDRSLDAKAMRQKATAMIAAVGLADKENRYPRELSGGQEQRVAIARALVKDPVLVLADEPTANLDSKTAAEIVDLMKDMNTRLGTTFIFSTHDRLVMEHARRIVELHDGRIVRDERRQS